MTLPGRKLHSIFVLIFLAALTACTSAPGPAVVSSGPTPVAVRVLDLGAVLALTPAPSATWTLPPTAAPTATLMDPTPDPAGMKPDPVSLEASPAPSACQDRAEFIRHLSVSPGSALLPSQWFTKIWRVRNAGACTWNTAYLLNYLSGETFGAALSQPLPQAVQPGESLDLRLNLIAPQPVGSYSGEWVLVDPQGENVPIASFESPQTSSLLVQITVRPPAKPKYESPSDGLPEDCG